MKPKVKQTPDYKKLYEELQLTVDQILTTADILVAAKILTDEQWSKAEGLAIAGRSRNGKS